MTNMQAAIGVAQLERLDEFVNRKRRMGALYTEYLQNVPGIRLPVVKTDYAENVYWVYGIVLGSETGFNAQMAMAALEKEGVGTRPFFYPMHMQPILRRLGLFQDSTLSNSESISQFGFYIPSGMALDDRQIEFVAHKIRKVIIGGS